MRQSLPQEALLQALHLCGTECADIQQDIERTARFEGESCMRDSFKPPSREVKKGDLQMHVGHATSSRGFGGVTATLWRGGRRRGKRQSAV